MTGADLVDQARAYTIAAELLARLRKPRPGFLQLIGADRTGEYDKADRPIWELHRPLLYFSKSWGAWLMVPARFRTNYASVPRLPFVYWWYGDRCWEEPALHDQLYTDHEAFVVTFDAGGRLETVRKVPITRLQADDLFLEALLLNPKTADGMDHTMYRGVRLGGQSSWEGDTTVKQTDYRTTLEPALA